ncbi:MAG TPA: hypothetical protein VGD01_14430 [Candidatus Elarobacter sp.]|jgi:hypothetical protein
MDALTYEGIAAMRRVLAERVAHPWNDYAAFVGSVVSWDDLQLLRGSLRRSTGVGHGIAPPERLLFEGDNAGQAALALVTRAGFVDFAADLRPWLLGLQDPGGEVYTSGPHVLYICATEFADGNALRLLLEFSDSENTAVKRNLERFRGDYAGDPAALLNATRSERVASQLPLDAGEATPRTLWTLKSFVDDARTIEFLTSAALAGRLHALLSLLFRGGPLNWELYERVRLHDDDDTRRYVNAVLENIARGADPAYRRKAVSVLCASFVAELDAGLRFLARAAPH